MANTYVAIATTTVGSSGASSIDFTSIPNTYTDLVVKMSARADGSSGVFNIKLNSNGSNYTFQTLYGTGTVVGSQRSASTSQIGPGSAAGNINWSANTASTFSNVEIYISNYASSNNKTISIDSVVENNATLAYALIEGAIWANSSAITSINLLPSGTEKFVQYTTATLYGIKNS